MARYLNVIPMVDSQENSFAQIRQYLTEQKYRYVDHDGEQVFQRGKGTWLAPSFIKVTYGNGFARVEAWVEGYGKERNPAEAANGAVVQSRMQKVVTRIEEILRQPGVDYVPPAPGCCRACGAALQLGAVSCTQCRQLIPEAQPHKPVSPIPAGEVVTKGKFRRKYAGQIQNREIRSLAILGYVLVGINLAVALLGNLYVLLDAAIYLGLLLGMHLGKSKGCAIGILAYGALGCILSLINTGVFSGYLWIILGISALVVFNNTDKRYKELTKSE